MLRKIIFALLAFVIFNLSFTQLAAAKPQTPSPTSTPTPTPVCENFTPEGLCITKGGDKIVTLKWLESLFGNVVGVALGFGGIILFVLLLIGGLKYITAGGDPKGIESAKKTITYAIFGIVLLALAFLILQLIQNLTGAPVTEFKISQ